MKKGYTLIELIVVITLLATAVFSVGMFVFKLSDSWVAIRNRENLSSSARVSMNRMIREIRRVNKPSQIVTMTATEFRFVDMGAGNVRFYQSGTDLYRDSDILASNLTDPGGLNFTYLDENGNVTGTKQDVRTIRITLQFTYGNEVYTLESSGRIRNLD